jgi:hypothetical protein
VWLSILAAVVLGSGEACSRNTARAPAKVTGVVVDVASQSLGHVRSFKVRSHGEVYKIFIDPTVTYSFPPAHLSAHLASAEPVRVGVETRNGRLYAVSMEDA